MDTEYKENQKLRNNLSKVAQFDIDKMVENSKKIF